MAETKCMEINDERKKSGSRKGGGKGTVVDVQIEQLLFKTDYSRVPSSDQR